MKIKRTVKFTFDEADRDIFQAAKRILDNMSYDDYEALADEFCPPVRELYNSLENFIDFIVDNME